MMDSITWRGEVEVQTFKRGRLWHVQHVYNKVTNGGLTRFAERMIGNATADPIKGIAVGTGATAVAVTDTELDTEVYRDAVTATGIPSTGALKARLFIGVDQANGNTLTEAGLFDKESTAFGGTLLARVLFDSEVVKDDTKSLQISWTITGSAG